MTLSFHELIEHNAEVPTWFRVGGRADSLARPATTEQMRDLLLAFADQPVRVLGDGANLLVDDEGVGGLVISLSLMNTVEAHGEGNDHPDGDVIVHAQAGANLPRLIIDTVRAGIAGLEGLGGIPATLGGAVIMNAGGTFGQIGDVVERVHALTRFGEPVTIPRDQLHFDYRYSGLNHLFVTAVDLRLRRVPPGAEEMLRDRLKDVMARKKATQPLKEDSAGCVFKNPVVRGERISAGKIIDQAGCKGMREGGAVVSEHHANFFIAEPGCAARDIIELIEKVREHVRDRTGIQLETEVVIWNRKYVPQITTSHTEPIRTKSRGRAK